MENTDVLETFQKEYQKLIHDFSIIDEKDPLSPEAIESLKTLFQQWHKDLKTNFFKHNEFLTNYLEKSNEINNDYHVVVNRLNVNLSEMLKTISEDHSMACTQLKEKIEDSKRKNLSTIEQLELDNLVFTTTSEQNIEILTRDFEEAKKRFDYQRERAKASYHTVVENKNIALDIIKAKLSRNYDHSVNIAIEEHQKLVAKLNQLIEEKTEELNSLMIALEKERNNMKERYRQESANLNEAIKQHSDEKNKLIDQARNQYNKSINDSIIEKENKKQIYQTKSQALLREFVTKINEIDENTANLKKQYEVYLDQLKRDYYTNQYLRTKDFHTQIEKIYATSSQSKIDKYTQHLIQYKNKQYIEQHNISKKETENQLLTLIQNQTISFQENKNNKNFLEIDKNFAIKEITNQEQFDNKYYQQKDNFYESDFNYIVKLANYKLTQHANTLKCQSQIRTKLLERNYDGIEANYYKRIEAIQNKINCYRLELKLANELIKIVLSYQEQSYLDRLHQEEVTNLIDIEKNKLLKKFNQSQYDYHIKIITLERDYGFKKIDLENQKAEKYKNLMKSIEDANLNKLNVSTSFAIKKEELEEKYAKMKANIKNNSSLRESKESYLSRLKQNDIYYLSQLTTSFTLFLDLFNDNVRKILTLVTHDLQTDNIHYLNSFTHSILKIILDLFTTTFNLFFQAMLKTIQDRINFIFEFKYKSSLDTIDENHQYYQEQIEESKNHILDEIDSCYKTIENFKQKIYTLDNDNEMLKQQHRLHRKKLDAVSIASIRENELKIKEYKEKIDDYTQMIKMHNDDLMEYDQKAAQYERNYEEEKKRIEKMINVDSLIHYNYQKIITHYDTHIHKSIEHMKNYFFQEVRTEKKFINKMNTLQKEITSFLTKVKLNMTTHLNGYRCDCQNDSANKQKQAKLESLLEIKQFSTQYNKAQANFQKEYQLTISTYDKQIHEQEIILLHTTAFYDSLLANAKANYKNDTTNYHYEFNQETNRFLSLYFAMDDNNIKILAFHKDNTKKRDAEFKQNKFICVSETNKQKNKENEKLKNFIESKDEEIEHLPVAFKFNSKMLNNETRKKNNQIHDDLKKAKIEHNLEHKRIDKEILNLRNQLNQEKNLNELNQKQEIAKEKRDYHNSLKQLLKGIKIEL